MLHLLCVTYVPKVQPRLSRKLRVSCCAEMRHSAANSAKNGTEQLRRHREGP
jgi:hypothetical protein